MSIRQRMGKDNFGFGKGQNAGVVKVAVLLSLAAFFIFLIFTLGVQQTKAEECDCGYCHGDQHGPGWQGCKTCHDSPPQTGTHATHYGGGSQMALVYGDTTVTSTEGAYIFGCGNCHPLDSVKHNNGVVDVELYNPAAPADSIKAKNPATAVYTPGTVHTDYTYNGRTFSWTNGACSNVYCHSGYVVTSSGPVGDPLTTADDPALFPPGYLLNTVNGISYIMDETCSNVQYAPYTVNSGREYKTTPAWGTTGSFSVCTECHQFPLTTWGPNVQAGVGDSHQWYNDWEGWNYGHANNMDYFPGLPCATCHYGTVDQRNGAFPPYPLDASNTPTFWTADNQPTYWVQVDGKWIKAYYPVPLRSRIMHVNGKPDVSFDTVNNYRYYYYCPPGNYGCWNINESYDLSTASYDPATKTCSNVGCHYSMTTGKWQQKVQWGSPYRGWYGPAEECDQCHRMGNLRESCTAPQP